MCRFLLFVLLLSLPCSAQVTTGDAKTEGTCSVANTGNDNKIQIDCGIGKEQGQKMLAILNKILADHLDADTVMAKLDEIQTGVSSIQIELDQKRQQEAAADAKRRTAPALFPSLFALDGKVAICITSTNLIPYEFRYFLANSKGNSLGGFPISMQPVYPTAESPRFCVPNAFDWKSIPDHYMKLWVGYQSLSFDELHLPGHAGEFSLQYAVASDGSSISLIP